jgi:uncharacterized protein YjbI with pentapeptide repeats
VVSQDSGEAHCLEDEVLCFVKGGQRGAILINGPPGAGKTTALCHLAAVLPQGFGVWVLDEPDEALLIRRAAEGVVVYTAIRPLAPKHLASFFLAPWGGDELIEYLLSAARQRCALIMTRLKTDPGRDAIGGNPELWAIVLDRMAASTSVVSLDDALRRELAARLRSTVTHRAVEDLCLQRLTTFRGASAVLPGPRPEHAAAGLNSALWRLVRHRPVQLLMAAARIADDLSRGQSGDYLDAPLPRDLVEEAGARLRNQTAALKSLRGVVDGDRPHAQPMAASLLLAAGSRWRPVPRKNPYRLAGAYLDRARWHGVDLRHADLSEADLSDAVLPRALLDGARLEGTKLRRSSLREALVRRASLIGADLGEADLTALNAEGANFKNANLERADFTGACLRHARLQEANLARARLAGADLTDADLRQAQIDGADFTGARLDLASMQGMTLSRSVFRDAHFDGTNLVECDLEGMELPDAHFGKAILVDAGLTGSRMPRADFRGACLMGARLAEIDWEGACLAGADLRKACFHLGSTRSGLVQSPIACEGSRTGFYTDDFEEQYFKSIEEIRKANLRSADLRGARIDDVDFYLVDLRDARFSAGQAEHFRRCGAILSEGPR